MDNKLNLKKVSDLTAHSSFKMRHSILSNLDNETRQLKKIMKMLKKHMNFLRKLLMGIILKRR